MFTGFYQLALFLVARPPLGATDKRPCFREFLPKARWSANCLQGRKPLEARRCFVVT